MIEDLRDASGPAERTVDVCIVGAGPAGLSIARAFLGKRHRVLLLESGGFECEPAAHDLLAGTQVVFTTEPAPSAMPLRGIALIATPVITVLALCTWVAWQFARLTILLVG